jgi:hypothetical protein
MRAKKPSHNLYHTLVNAAVTVGGVALLALLLPACAAPPTEIPATPTAVPSPAPTPIVIKADDVISQIKGVDGEIQKLLSWWTEVDYGKKDSQLLDPTPAEANQSCVGMAWNTNEQGYHRLIVFQKPATFTFADGGWYIKVCRPDTIVISAEDMGRIQADWLGKRYGIDEQPWQVILNE